MTLTPEDRVQLAEELIASVISDQDVDDAWADEIERRAREIDSGHAPLAPTRPNRTGARRTGMTATFLATVG